MKRPCCSASRSSISCPRRSFAVDGADLSHLGDNLLEQAEHLPPERAEKLRRQARTQFRRAGDSLHGVGPRTVSRPASIRSCFGTAPAPILPATTSAMRPHAAAVHAQRGPPAACPGPGRSGRGRTLAGRDGAGLAVVPGMHPAAPPRRGHLSGAAAGQPGRDEHWAI